MVDLTALESCQEIELVPVPGMRLRDYFAAHAVQGLLANPEVSGTNASLAADAYDMADQMMEERSHD